MKISARNQFPGVVRRITVGPVSAIVIIELAGGQMITSVITAPAVKELGLKKGKSVVAIIKASNVILGVE